MRFEQITAEEIIEKLRQLPDEAEEPVYKLRHRSVVGKLDLKHCTIEIAVDIQDCEFQDEVDLRYCEFEQAVDFSRCTFCRDFNSGDPAESHTIYRKDLICNEAVFEGAARFYGNRVEGSAYFSETVFKGPANFCSLKCEEDGDFRNAKFESEHEVVNFSKASFGADLHCNNVTIRGQANFNSLTCGGYGFFNSAKFEGEGGVVFEHASFSRKFECNQTIFDQGTATFNSLECGGTGYFRKAEFRSGEEVDFAYSSFAGNLDCNEAIFQGPADFFSLKCGGHGLFHKTKFKGERGTDEGGGVRFRSASFGADLDCDGAEFENGADFKAIRCEGFAKFEGANFRSEHPVYLLFTYFSSKLNLTDARFAGPVDLTATRVSQELILTDAEFERDVTLRGATIRMLRVNDESSEDAGFPDVKPESLDLRECTFEIFSGSEDQARKLAGAQDPTKFSRDPYLQLEKYYRGVGNELEAKRMHFKGCSELRKNAWRKEKRAAQWPRLTKLSDASIWLLTGYGVQTWRLLIPIFFFLGVGTWVFWPSEALVPPPGTHGQSNEGQANAIYLASTVSRQEQSQDGLGQQLFDRVSYSLDLFLPVVNLHIDENWQPNGLGRKIYAVVHSMVGWILVPLLLASLTGILRRE